MSRVVCGNLIVCGSGPLRAASREAARARTPPLPAGFAAPTTMPPVQFIMINSAEMSCAPAGWMPPSRPSKLFVWRSQSAALFAWLQLGLRFLSVARRESDF